jgi:phosphopantothenoylcysteine decarboxylase/phosphopantothenate--cysteine ligase
LSINFLLLGIIVSKKGESTIMLENLQNKRVLLGITGGIAAYKTPEIVRLMREYGAEVKVVMTDGATKFITPLTLQAVSSQRVHLDLLDLEAEAGMGHIELARWADIILVAPTSADALARINQGRADDLLSTVIRASNAPIVLAPSMNKIMWQDPAVQENVESLKRLKFRFIGPDSGLQACGDEGPGRMTNPIEIVEYISSQFSTGSLAGKHVLLTAGPTREKIDPVRYLSNFSSGKMGFALAEAAVEAGARVTLIAGPVGIEAPSNIKRVDVISADEMYKAVHENVEPSSIFISTAAVADFKPQEIKDQKIKKSTDHKEFSLNLVENDDIIKSLSYSKHLLYIVGFAAETENVLNNARKKLETKQLDMVVANDVSRDDIGFSSDDNEVKVLLPNSEKEIKKCTKQQLARHLISIIAEQVCG